MDKLVHVIKNHDIIIVDDMTKDIVLNIRNTFPRLKFKIYTRDQVVELFYGKKSEKTLFAVLRKTNYNLVYATLLNDHIIFSREVFNSHKTKELVTLRHFLIDEGILGIDPLAKHIFTNKKILMSHELLNDTLIQDFFKSISCDITYLGTIYNYKPSLFLFKSGVEEIYYILNEISKLIESGISPNKINVVTPNPKYEMLFRSLAYQFNLQFSAKKESLYNFPLVEKLIKSFHTVTDLHDSFKEESLFNEPELKMLFNLYQETDFASLVEKYHLSYFINKVKERNVSLTQVDGINFINTLPLFSFDDTYYFYPNFAQGFAPKPRAGSILLTNSERASLGLLTDEKLGVMEDTLFKDSLMNIKHLILTFSPSLEGEVFTLSPLVDEFEIPKNEVAVPSLFYSESYLNYLTGLLQDDYHIYNMIDDNLPFLLSNNVHETSYSSYDYTFKGISYNHGKIRLSYSAMELYQNLPFDYFAKYLLKLHDDELSFELNIGNFVHKVFENSSNLETFKYSYYHYLDQYPFSFKEKFFIDNLYTAYEFAFENYLAYIELSKPCSIFAEEIIEIQIHDELSFVGKLDRLLLYKKGDNYYGVVIDFKTGKTKVNAKNFNDGLNLQLPLYGLLISNSSKFNHVMPSALVLNGMKVPAYVLQDKDLLQESLKPTLLFHGFVTGDESVLKVIDPNYFDSDFYKGLKVLKKGGLKGVVDQAVMDEYIKQAYDAVIATYEGIRKNDFRVEPKILKDGSKTGGYSPYKEISYLPSYTPLSEDESDE